MRTDSRGAVIDRRNETPQVPRQPQWEDRVAVMELDADLGQFYTEGWELVTEVPVHHDPMMAVFRFRRRRQ